MENETNISIIIPSAGMSKRMKSYGPKSLIDIDGRTILDRQLTILQSVYPKAEIVVVCGFHEDKIKNFIKCWSDKRSLFANDILTTSNKNYNTTNVAESIRIGISACNHSTIIVVMGDLIFNEQAISFPEEFHTSIIMAPKGSMLDTEVGVNIVNGKAMQFAYTLPDKWAQIMMLCDRDIDIFYEMANHQKRKKYFAFEILNLMMNTGVDFPAYQPDGMKIAELDTAKDIEKIKKIL